MVRRAVVHRFASHLVSQEKNIFIQCKEMFAPFYQLFGGHVGYQNACSKNNFNRAGLLLNEADEAEFIAQCEHIRKVLQEQGDARRLKLTLLENTLAKLKFMSLKYHLKP